MIVFLLILKNYCKCKTLYRIILIWLIHENTGSRLQGLATNAEELACLYILDYISVLLLFKIQQFIYCFFSWSLSYTHGGNNMTVFIVIFIKNVIILDNYLTFSNCIWVTFAFFQQQNLYHQYLQTHHLKKS